MITSQGLQKLGFKSLNMVEDGDFLLEDAGDGTYIKEWKSASPQPAEAEIESAHLEWQSDQDSKAYARNRKAEYPTTEELVVALWEAVIEERMASSIDLQGKRTAIKEKHPK